MLELSSAVISLVAAAITLIASLMSYRRTDQPPPQPGRPAPKSFSAKAILRGWISALIWWGVGAVLIGSYLVSQTIPQVKQRIAQKHNLPPDQLYQLPKADYDEAWREFAEESYKETTLKCMESKAGFVIYVAFVGFFTARGGRAAAKTAKRFQKTHAFVAIGSFYILMSLLLQWLLGPHIVAEWAEGIPDRIKFAEMSATIVGTLIGAILGQED